MAIASIYNYKNPQKSSGQLSGLKTQKTNNIKKNVNSYSNNSDKYLEQKVMTAKPEELTLMLYEGIIKFLNQAKIFMEQKNIDKTNNRLLRAQAIVDELSGTLDMEFEHSMDLQQLYAFMSENLLEANLKKEMKPLDDALAIAVEMRQMWKEVMEAAR